MGGGGAKTGPAARALGYGHRVGTKGSAGQRIARRRAHIVAFGFEDSMFTDAFPDRLFELRGLEQSRAVGNTSDGLVGLKYFASRI